MAKTESSQEWVKEEFGGAQLGDGRRTKRLMKVVEGFASKPQASVMESSLDWAEAKAAYRFLDTDVEAREISRWHEKRTRERMRGKAVVLAVQDTTTLNYSKQKQTQGLGSIGTRGSGARGYFCHVTLAVDGKAGVLGVLQAVSYSRQEKAMSRRRGPVAEEAESRRWLQSLEACQEAASENPETMVVSVADRECDFYEFFEAAAKKAEGVKVLVRLKHDRKLEFGSIGEKLAEVVSAGQRTIEVPRQGQRAARKVTLEVRYCRVELRAPSHWLDLAHQRAGRELCSSRGGH